MAKFTYQAKKGLNEAVEGVIEAETQEDAVSKLIEQGAFPVKVVDLNSSGAENTKQAEKRKQLNTGRKFRRGVSSKDLLVFTQQLSTLMRARVELLSSLRILYEQSEPSEFKGVIQEIYSYTKEGKPFSESLAHFPKIFSPLFVNIIKAGETSGRLDFALSQINDFLDKQQKLRTKVAAAVAYPVLLLGVGMVSIFILINFVIPKLARMFDSMGKDLPLITKFILSFSRLSQKTTFWLIPLIAAVILIIFWRKGWEAFSGKFRRIRKHIPVLKSLFANQEFAHFSRSLSLLIKSGVPVLQSLQVAMQTIEDPVLKAQLGEVRNSVANGETFSKSLDTKTGLPRFFIKMIAIGEESGRISEVLDEVSSSYSQRVEADVAIISSLLEPVLILFLGTVLGVIVLSILLPIFQLTSAVH
jgi:type II secretory pathway component PulF